MRSRTALKTREKGTGSIYKVKNRFYLKHRINGKSKAMMLRNADGSPCTTIREAEKAARGFGEVDAGRLADETHPYAPADVNLEQPNPHHPAARRVEEMVHGGS